MSLINASIPNLINGVSQQPPSLRLKTQAALQENGLSSVVKGLSKRPCTELVANLGNLAGAEDAFIHTMRRDENEYYTLIVTATDILVYDKDGVSKTITNNAGSYLSGLTNPKEQIAATTIADYTFIVNKTTNTAEATATAASRPNEALVYVKQGDYSTNYTIKITKGGTVHTRTIETMGSTQPDDAAARTAERSIQTDRLTENLIFSNAVDATYYGGTSGALTIPNMTYTQYGNVIHLETTDGSDFQIDVEDSRGNTHIFAFKETVADFKKLPPAGPEGFVMGVLGSNDKGQDDYYVQLQVIETGGQVWKETIKPGIKTDIDPSSMPHKLVSNANGTFTFEAATFKAREVGDDETNPYPSFIGLPLNDVFFHRNRLGLLADENVILSEAGQFTDFNFFKRTTLTLLDTDPIDAAVSNNKVSILKHAVPFNESLLLFSDLTQFRLTAEDLLTPETVAIDVTTQFEASLAAKPVGAGRYVFFATNRNKWSGIREYFVDTGSEVDDAADITAHIPEYIKGKITKMEASSNEDILLALSEDDPKAIYVYSYYWQGQDKLQSSWSRWTFEGSVLNMSFNKSNIDLLMSYGNVASPDWTRIASAMLEINVGSKTAADGPLYAWLENMIGLYKRSDVNTDTSEDISDVIAINRYAINIANDPAVDAWIFENIVTPLQTVSFTDGIIPAGTTSTIALERINLSSDTAIEHTLKSHGIFLDRRQLWGGSNTTIDTSITPVGSVPMYIADNGSVLTETAALQYVTGGGKVFYGSPYNFKYTFSEQVTKNENEAILSGRLQLRKMTLVYNDTGYFEVHVTPDGREKRVNKFTGRVVGSLANLLNKAAIETGKYSFPVLANASSVEIEIQSNSYLPVVFQSAEYEGFFTMRSRRA